MFIDKYRGNLMDGTSRESMFEELSHSIDPSLGFALAQKRIVMRQIGEDQEGIYIQCKQIKAELEEDMGRLRIKRIIE